MPKNKGSVGSEPTKAPIIIGGCPRSGTTLLRTMLDSHPNIYSGPELAITMQTAQAAIDSWNRIGDRAAYSYGLEDGDFAEGFGKALEHVLERIREKSGKPRVADKMPQSIQHFPTLCWMLPESKFVHVIRDGRDVAASLLRRDDMFDDNTGELMDFCKNPISGVRYWSWIVQRGMKLRSPHPCSDRYYELYYEDLVNFPKETMVNLLEFLDEPWDESVLEHSTYEHNMENDKGLEVQPVTNSRIGRWKDQLNDLQKKEVHMEIGKMLRVLNYI